MTRAVESAVSMDAHSGATNVLEDETGYNKGSIDMFGLHLNQPTETSPKTAARTITLNLKIDMRILSQQSCGRIQQPSLSHFVLATFFLACATCARANDVFITAAVGTPFGAATIEMPLDAAMFGRTFPALRVSGGDGRVLYPVSNDLVTTGRPSERPVPQAGGGRLLNRVGGLIRELASGDQELNQTVARRVSFLFTGSEPLTVTVTDDRGVIGNYSVVPQQDQTVHTSVLKTWWTGYTNAVQSLVLTSEQPAAVQLYLVAMLARRTGLPLPTWYNESGQAEDQLLSTLQLIGGAAGVGESIFAEAAVETRPPQLATEPLPAPPRWIPEIVPSDVKTAIVEPIATKVPPDCFYIRYGSFQNYLWFQDLTDEHGGDITRMITLRGLVNDSTERLETQLNMKMTQLSRMLGGTVIEDQALIGRDLFLTDGASMGVLIKSRNAFLLTTSIKNDRTKLAQADTTVTLEDFQINGREVSLLSTADNRIRSFFTQDGNYIFVSNSHKLTEQFIEVAKSGKSLAKTPEFMLARKLMPLERDDTIFAYFSPAMLRGLVSPEYLIELRRRMFAKADISLVQLARMAGAMERKLKPSDLGVEQLIAAGMLPPNFGSRSDGSGVFELNNAALDTMRGARGSFLPIADVEIKSVTPDEFAWYSEIANEYTNRFASMDPIMLGIHRDDDRDPNSNRERLTIHAEVAPFNPGKYGKYAQQLGPPTQVAMQFAPDDIISLQAHVASEQLGPPTHLFAAIKDTVPPTPEQFEGIIKAYLSLRQLPGYLGAWPQPSTLDRLPLGLGRGQPVGPGMSRLLGGLYRFTDGKFSILSFQPEVITQSLPFLAATDDPTPAQIRANVGDLNGSQLEGWANGQLYARSRISSVATAQFLDSITRQFQLTPDEVLSTVKSILGADVQCSLGGQYEWSEQRGQWQSTAWNGPLASPIAPVDYVAPAMKWFRGANISVTQFDDRVIADAIITLARE